MRCELQESDTVRIQPLFTGPHLELLMDAVIARNSPARVWVDAADQPRTALLWDRAGCYYLAGDAENTPFNAGVAELVDRQVAHGFSYFKIHYTSDAWEKVISAMFKGVSPVKRDRLLLVLKQPGSRDWKPDIPSGFRVQQIDASLLGDERLGYREAVAGEICSCWNAIDDFVARGFGYAVLYGDEIVCWCTAEYVSEAKCGIGIETVRQYQGRGLATAAASAFVEHARAKRMTPYWDSWKDNLASLAVAGKIGFEELLEYSVYVGKV